MAIIGRLSTTLVVTNSAWHSNNLIFWGLRFKFLNVAYQKSNLNAQGSQLKLKQNAMIKKAQLLEERRSWDVVHAPGKQHVNSTFVRKDL